MQAPGIDSPVGLLSRPGRLLGWPQYLQRITHIQLIVAGMNARFSSPLFSFPQTATHSGRYRRWSTALAAGAFLGLAGQSANGEIYTPTAQGIVLNYGHARIELAALTPDILRLSVGDATHPNALASTFLNLSPTNSTTSWQIKRWDGFIGIATPSAALLFDPSNGTWTLRQSDGTTLIPAHALFTDIPVDQDHWNLALGWEPQLAQKVYGSGNGVDHLQQNDGQ
ncbi:MAG TPA: hypothetical protein VF607_04490, partial [Verrucomicrobiae bacterium]